MTFKKAVLFFLILSIASFFRFYGVNWDQNHHLHPDERFLTMVTETVTWPRNILEYLSTDISPLNPQNRGYGFFVYGTFPVFFTKFIAEGLKNADYNGITIIGRKLSALFDLGTAILIFLIAYEIEKERKNRNSFFPHLAMFFYASSVLPVQLSHFYAVDTFLVFFLTLSFYFFIKILNSTNNGWSASGGKYLMLNSILLGISFGLAVSSKISVLFFLPVLGLGLLFYLYKTKKYTRFFVICCLLSVVCYLTVRFAYPYLFKNPSLFNFTLNPKILDNWKQLKSFDDPSGGFPPAVQWIKTRSFVFPLKNLLFWGLGLPLGLLALVSIVYQLVSFIIQAFKKKIHIILNLSLTWILFLFIYQGHQFVKALRYFFPLYPFLAILSAWFFYQILKFIKNFKKFYLLSVICYLLFVLLYPFSFISIYSRPHTRITASDWIYRNIPAGSRISGEHWDDFLPLNLPVPGYSSQNYQGVEYPLYGADTEEKWQIVNRKLAETDYIILTSNRLYGSIMTVPEKYPVTYRYYQALFDGSLGFDKVAEFTSRPNLPLPFIRLCLTPPFARYGIIAKNKQSCPLPGISFVSDYADETFTVYDHPKVIIFKKTKPVDYLKLLYD